MEAVGDERGVVLLLLLVGFIFLSGSVIRAFSLYFALLLLRGLTVLLLHGIWISIYMARAFGRESRYYFSLIFCFPFLFPLLANGMVKEKGRTGQIAWNGGRDFIFFLWFSIANGWEERKHLKPS